jgi:ATP-dependent Lhr-like helicase
MAAIEAQLQLLDERYHIHTQDGVHDALLRVGDLSQAELLARTRESEREQLDDWLTVLQRTRRIVPLRRGGGSDVRFVAVEDAGRYRDALGVVLPPGLPEALLTPVADPLRDLTLRYARTHATFTLNELAERLGLGRAVAAGALERLLAEGKLLEGAFRPGGTQREYANPDVLRSIRQRSLAKLRKEVEPVDSNVLGRYVIKHHNLNAPRAGLDAVLDAVEKLQGLALPASVLEREILPARVHDYRSEDLDALAAAGEIMWCGVEPLGERDGRVALYLTDHFPRLWQPAKPELNEREAQILELLAARGASFFNAIHAAIGGYPQLTVDALWSLVWKGVVTNDTFRALRAYVQAPAARHEQRRSGLRGFRSRRESPRAAEGRWSLPEQAVAQPASATERATALAETLLLRYGVVTREVASAENIVGGFSAVYDVFKALEESGRVRRGYFVSGVGAMQFAAPGVLEALRQLRRAPDESEVVHLAATDPANVYGALLKWPPSATGRSPSRTAQARVILVDGALAAYFTRAAKQLQVFLPETEPDRTRTARAVAERLKLLASSSERSGLLIAEINAQPAHEHPLAEQLREQGFHPSSSGYYLPRRRPKSPQPSAAATQLSAERWSELESAIRGGGSRQHTADPDLSEEDEDELPNDEEEDVGQDLHEEN